MHGARENRHPGSRARPWRDARWLLCATLAAVALACGGRADAQLPPEPVAVDAARANAALPPDTEIDLAHGADVVFGSAECTASGRCLSCFQCHQVQGEGSALAGFPRLAGQPLRYLYSALRDYAAGRRQSETMEPVARALPPAAMRDVAAYYSAQDAASDVGDVRAAQLHESTTERLALGGRIAAIGLAEKGVQACANCHGPQGAGLPPTYPYLAGQYSQYLETQLAAFKSGLRKPDGPGGAMMVDIAQRLSSDEARAVADYFAGLRPPRIVRESDYSTALLPTDERHDADREERR